MSDKPSTSPSQTAKFELDLPQTFHSGFQTFALDNTPNSEQRAMIDTGWAAASNTTQFQPPPSSLPYQRPLPTSLSFAHNFWGEDDKGLDALIQRMKEGKHVANELTMLFRERATIEAEYGKKLSKLVKTFSVKEEIGTLKDSLEVARMELETTARTHLDLSNEIKIKLEKPLSDLIISQRAARKNHHANVDKTLKQKQALLANLMKIKEKYEGKVMEANSYIYSIPTLTPKEVEKVRGKLDKAQSAARSAELEYISTVERIVDLHSRWIDEMRAACHDCQNMESERLHFVRGALWNYSNFVSAACVADDEGCERLRQSLENCDPEKDILIVVQARGTGTLIPPPLRGIAFAMGVTPLDPGGVLFALPVSSLNFPGQGFTHAHQGSVPTTSSQPAVDSNGPRQSLQSVPSAISPSKYTESLPPLSAGLSPTFSLEHPAPPIQSTSQPSDAHASWASPANIDGMDPWSKTGTDLPSNNNPSNSTSKAHDTVKYDPYTVPPASAAYFTVTSLYDYMAQSPEELSIAKGQEIPVLVAHEDGWWEGLGTDDSGKPRKGLFPSNFTTGKDGVPTHILRPN